jgi:hypothetical protein
MATAYLPLHNSGQEKRQEKPPYPPSTNPAEASNAEIVRSWVISTDLLPNTKRQPIVGRVVIRLRLQGCAGMARESGFAVDEDVPGIISPHLVFQ